MSFINLLVRNDDGREALSQVPPGSYVIGRELTCDVVIASQGVSRRHAMIHVSEDAVTVEDLGSSSGTLIDGEMVSGQVTRALPVLINLGHYPIKIFSAKHPFLPQTSVTMGSIDSPYEIGLTLSAASKGAPDFKGVDARMRERLEMLYQLPLQFAAERNLETLFNLILQRVLDLIPGAVRGALLVREKESGKLTIRASIPADSPPISRTLIRRAALEQSGFIWEDSATEQKDVTASMAAIGVRTGMYAPLVWNEEAIGVIFVDNPKRRGAFSEDDLQFLLSVAHYAAASVANQMLQEEIQQNNKTLQHLLANFSPKIRDRLLQKSREGKLQPGGEKSNVTILLSDLRGFTKTSSSLDSGVVVDMLNDYFQVLGAEIFKNDGTIDKFIGDAILAVFGSPEPDADHAFHAVTAAIGMQLRMNEVNQRRKANGLPTCDLGIGVYTGEVLHGFIGAEDCLEYTVIGDTVNKASRYCDVAAGGDIVVGTLTNELLATRIATLPVQIKTKHEGELPAFKVLSESLP
jgi:adenylate cyclase